MKNLKLVILTLLLPLAAFAQTAPVITTESPLPDVRKPPQIITSSMWPSLNMRE